MIHFKGHISEKCEKTVVSVHLNIHEETHFSPVCDIQVAEKSTIWPGHIPLFWATEAPIVGQNPVYRSQMEPLAMGVRHRAQTERLEHGLRV